MEWHVIPLMICKEWHVVPLIIYKAWHVDRTGEVSVDKETLPTGGHRNGIITTVVHDINFGTDNIEFKRETYYIAQTGHYFIAPLPEGYDAE